MQSTLENKARFLSDHNSVQEQIHVKEMQQLEHRAELLAGVQLPLKGATGVIAFNNCLGILKGNRGCGPKIKIQQQEFP